LFFNGLDIFISCSAVRLPDKIDHACFRFVASFDRPDKLLRSPPPVGDGDSALRSLR
jgi:hypothetical protein